MNVGSCFSGIGGLDCGLARAGLRHSFFCESDPWRRQVLAHHWPGVPIHDDICAVESPPHAQQPGRVHSRIHAEYELRSSPKHRNASSSIDLLCGGFPCQDVSVAGQRRGLAGERSGLFYEFARIAESLRPRWILVENVPGLLSSNGGRDFGAVVGTLADIGYGVAWRILDSRFFGVPQRRRRVFIVGTLAVGDPRAAAERAGEVLAVGSRCDRHPPAGTEARAGAAVASLNGLGTGGPDDNYGQAGRLVAETVRSHPRPGSNSNGNIVAAPLTKGSATGDGVNPPGRRQEDDVNLVPYTFDWQMGGSWSEGGQPSRSWIQDTPGRTRSLVKNKTLALHSDAGVRRLTPIECERLQGLPDGWTDLGGTPDSRRYSGLGDAVTATVAEWIGRRLVAA